MSQALYRKYRSKSLDEIVGQQHITNVLQKALAQKRIGHAFLFTGPRGTGKTSIARILAYAINDLPYTNNDSHLDIIEIDAASNRRIDDIRDLREKVHVAPSSAPYKVYIIDEVHMLTGESFNALLKTLEEPPAHVIFMLATTEVHKLPATIISRTQRFHLRLIPEGEVIKHLQFIAEQEKINITEDALRLVAQHGEGSFRDSISLLDQLGSLAGKDAITAEMVEGVLGLAPRAQIAELLTAVLTHKLDETVRLLDELENNGVSAATLTTQIIRALRAQSKHSAEMFTLIDQLLEVPRSHHPHIKLLTILAGYAAQDSQPTRSAALAAPLPAVSAPITALRQKPHQPREAKKPEPQPHPPVIPNEPAAQTTEPADHKPYTGEFAWSDVVDRIRQKHAPLYSVLRHAAARYESGTLELYFNHALHRKKIDDSKYRTLLVSDIIELYGGCPTITTIVGAAPPQDETAASVVELLGGGEEVNVT